MRSSAARRIVWIAAIALSLAGMWISWSLALAYYRVSTADAGLLNGVCTAAADAFKNASCEKVSQSRWGWFPPLPDTSEKSEKHDADDQNKQDKPGKAADDPFATGKDARSADKEAAKQDTSKQAAATQATSKKDGDKIYPGVPTGQLGLMYYTFAFCWLLFASPVKANRVWPQVILLVASIMGALGSVAFDVIMWTQLDTWCALCMIAHAISLVMVILVLLLWPRRQAVPAGELVEVAASSESEPSTGLFTPIPEPQVAPMAAAAVWPTNRVVLMTVVMAVVMMVGEHFHIMKAGVNRDLVIAKYYRETYEKQFKRYDRYWMHNYYAWAIQPQLDIPIEGRAMFGPADAPHTLVIFSDFECPSCKRLASYIHDSVIPMSRKLPNGGLRMVFKHWPIGKDCNATASSNLHPKACQASYAAEAARLVGGDEAFWKMHDLLFADRDNWKKTGEFAGYAKQIGLDETAFKKAMVGSEAVARVRQDVQDGIELGKELTDPKLAAEMKIDGTPALFIDGRRLNNPTRWETWRAILQTPPKQSKNAGMQGGMQGSQPRQSSYPRQASQPSIRIQLGK